MIQSVDYSADFGAVPPPGTTQYVTAGGIEVTRTVAPFEPDQLTEITKLVDDRRGGVFSSGMEYPGRYSRWHTAYVDPCVEFTGRGRQLTATALNDRGAVLLPAIAEALAKAGQLREPPRPASRWRSPSPPNSCRKSSAAAARPCSARSGRSSRCSPAPMTRSPCSAPSATTWRSSSSRSGCARADDGRCRSATWSCTCLTRST